MPVPYTEPGNISGSALPQKIAMATARAADAAAKAGGGSLGTLTTVNSGDVTIGASETVIAALTNVTIPAGAKVIIYASLECDVNTPESGGAANTVTIETRYAVAPGPAVVVDSLSEDLILGASLTILHNIITMVSETPTLAAAATYVFDVVALSTTAGADFVPNGKGRITIQVVGS